MHSALVTFLLGYVEWKNVGQHRRAPGCPRRNVSNLGHFRWMGAVQSQNQAAGRKSPGVINRKNVLFCVGNGFRPSETSVNIHGSLDGNGFLFSTFFHSMCTP